MKTTLLPKDIKKINERIGYLVEKSQNCSESARQHHISEIGVLKRCLMLHLEVCRNFPDEQDWDVFKYNREHHAEQRKRNENSRHHKSGQRT